ncbi:hypothetical protein J2X32_004050 [Rheinheimera pacifica]|uniref:hypothetical protein n=1 Tax=Rheinheimera pacifica TaxID=173990 RepID=UPI002854882B|nr:hypothetical protein [Rheinheimera pacifica]MDR6985385.1 hypothetical protein [Rheinheimera pacifica]
MKRQVIYIEDELTARKTFARSLRRMYGAEYDIETPNPEHEILDMQKLLFSYKNPVAFIFDEKLKFTGTTNYLGSELAEKVREIDSKIPIYILTSFAGEVDPLAGSVEFIIDKTMVGDPEKRDQLACRLRRHQDTFDDIRTERAKKFDHLLKKSINYGLTEEELKVFDELNFVRVKPILFDESIPTLRLEAELKKQDELLDRIIDGISRLKE